MLCKLKHILETYTDEELEKMGLWIDSTTCVECIIIENDNINLISNEAEIKINDYVEKESYDVLRCK